MPHDKCKYAVREKDHIYCSRDGSIRTKGCPCAHHTPTFWSRVKKWFNDHFYW